MNLYRYVGNHATRATDPSGLQERPQLPTRPRQSIGGDILKDLHREHPAFRPGIEQLDSGLKRRKKEIGEAGLRTFADLGGFGPAIDAMEAGGGCNVLSAEGERLSTAQRLKSGAWAAIGLIPAFVDGVITHGRMSFMHRADDAAEYSRGTHKLADILSNRAKYRFIGTAAQKQKYINDLADLKRQFGKIDHIDQVGIVNGKIAYGSFDPATGRITIFRGGDDLTEFEELLHWRLHNERLRLSRWSQADFLKRWNDPCDSARRAFRRQYYDAAEAEIPRLLRDIYGWVLE